MSVSDKSDEELIDAAEMHLASLSELHQALVKRGVECDCYNYSGGKIEFKYERVTREKLRG